jgi:hypothetical protein
MAPITFWISFISPTGLSTNVDLNVDNNEGDGAEASNDGTDGTGATGFVGGRTDDRALPKGKPVEEPWDEGVEPTSRERLEEGLQDTMNLRNWRMPSARDYFWYLVVYGTLIALAVWVIWRYQLVGIYILWGGYLVTLVVFAFLILRSFTYRRGTYSKSFSVATLDLQQAVERAFEEVGLGIDRVDRPENDFLRPIIGVYQVRKRDYTVSVEGRSHLARKVVRVGRLGSEEVRVEGMRLCAALDRQMELLTQSRSRSLFHED